AEDVDDVAVADLVDRPRLGDEPRHHRRIRRVLAAQHLDGDLLADERVLGAEHRAEAALPDLGRNDVLADRLAALQIGIADPDRVDSPGLGGHLTGEPPSAYARFSRADRCRSRTPPGRRERDHETKPPPRSPGAAAYSSRHGRSAALTALASRSPPRWSAPPRRSASPAPAPPAAPPPRQAAPRSPARPGSGACRRPDRCRPG